jgi:hypothetical protein
VSFTIEETLWNALLFKCSIAFYGGQLGFSIFFPSVGEKLGGESSLTRVKLGFSMACKWLGCEFNKFVGSTQLVNHK